MILENVSKDCSISNSAKDSIINQLTSALSLAVDFKEEVLCSIMEFRRLCHAELKLTGEENPGKSWCTMLKVF